MSQISFYLPAKNKEGKAVPGVTPKEAIGFETYLEGIRDGRWEKEVLGYRAGRIEKSKLPGVTPSGTFTYRAAGSLQAHSGIIALDFDEKDNLYFPADEIATDPFVYAFHRSAGGKGYAVYIRIDPAKHAESYLSLEKHFADNYRVMADPSGKDVGRFRFVSLDDELYHNPHARVWKKYLPKKTAQIPAQYVHTGSDVEHVMNQLRLKGANICDSYHDWLRVGMGFASTYGEGGRAYFHQVSSLSHKYDPGDCDKKFDNMLKSASGKTSVATFFYLAKQAGCQIKTERTAHIERVATMRRLQVGKNGGYQTADDAKTAAVRILTEVDGMTGDDIEEIVEQVMALPEGELKREVQDGVADLKEFLRGYDLKYNEITGAIEVDGQHLSDRIGNSIYVKALETLAGSKTKVSKELLFAVLESDFVPSYHPIRQHFINHSHIYPTGLIEALIDCMRIRDLPYIMEEGRVWSGKAFAQLYLRKWLISCVASWHGTYSVMMVVLTGAQAAGKTNFFRKLLPEALRRFYADNKLDKGNADDLILMASKAIICDDEFSGKSKQDYKLLKEMISKQTITARRPYARFSEDLERIAVLCGCSNEEEVINDPTGNRRIIPIPLIDIDWEKYNAIDKTALWMEIYHEWRKSGDSWMLTKDEVRTLNILTTNAAQVAAEEESIWMFFDHPDNGGRVEYLTNTEIKNIIETGTRLHVSSTKLGLFLQKNGFAKKTIRNGKNIKHVYGVVKKQSIGYRGSQDDEPIPF